MRYMSRRVRRAARTLGAALAAALILTTTLGAQPADDGGRIVGRVVDAASGQGLADAVVQVVGTALGTSSGIDGRFTITGVPAGELSLQARRIGYAPKTVTGVELEPGGLLEQHISLATVAVQLDAQVVTAEAERGSLSAALDVQRNATGIVSALGSEQIARSPDGDAAQAVQRVSGVTVQDGKYVFVRGLGERYTATSLNGARLPSPEPEKKVVPLDLFPSSLLQGVTTSKTFTPDQPGDFSGALVNLRTREFPGAREMTYSISTGVNSAATGRTVFAAPREGLEWAGFGGDERRLPAAVAARGKLDQAMSGAEYRQLVGSFRNVWTAQRRQGAPNGSASVSAGGTAPVFGRDIGYAGALSYSYGQEVRADEVRAYAMPDAGGGTYEQDRFEGSTGRESVLWGGLLNLSTMLGTSSRISMSNTYSRSADNEARFETGFSENLGMPLEMQRLRFVERSVWSSQLAGEHELGADYRLEWSLTGAGVSRDEPDRSELVYARDATGGEPFLFSNNESAVRTFGALRESSLDASADLARRFASDHGRDHRVRVGAALRGTMRDAGTTSYSLQATLPREELERTAEEIFSREEDVYYIVPLAQGGSYEASDLLGAAYVMGEYQLGERTQVVGGVRVESQRLEVTAQPTFGGAVTVRPTYTDVLPSLAVNFAITGDQTIRLSASQTLARPEYREIAPVAGRDVLGGEQLRGNPELSRTLIRNLDARWEWYPDAGEILSFGVFAKSFVDPIERVYRGTSGTRVTEFRNAAGAFNYGLEAEARKGLGFLGAPLDPLSAFANVTVMRSEIDLSNVAAGSIESERAMVGQAPYVVNAGLTYAPGDGAFSATALYNVVGRRIHSASLLPLPSVYEEARHVLDVSLRFPITGRLSGKLDAKNLLDSPYEITQGDVVRESYRAGRVVSAGLTWRP
ncbi:MAG TPA: TonB-dependent receptor [Gemmatimonadales bacterium]